MSNVTPSGRPGVVEEHPNKWSVLFSSDGLEVCLAPSLCRSWFGIQHKKEDQMVADVAEMMELDE